MFANAWVKPIVPRQNVQRLDGLDLARAIRVKHVRWSVDAEKAYSTSDDDCLWPQPV